MSYVIQKSENTIFSFRRTHEAAVRNSKILVVFNGDLGTANAAPKDSPLNYESEFCNTVALKIILISRVQGQDHQHNPARVLLPYRSNQRGNTEIRFRRNDNQGKL